MTFDLLRDVDVGARRADRPQLVTELAVQGLEVGGRREGSAHAPVECDVLA